MVNFSSSSSASRNICSSGVLLEDNQTINALAHLLADTSARLAEVIAKGQYDRVFFLSREGLLFYRSLLASPFRGEIKLPCIYLLTSRRALALATIYSLSDCFRILSIPFHPQPLGSLLSSRFGVNLAGTDNPIVSRHEKTLIRKQIKKQCDEILNTALEERLGYTAYLALKGMTAGGRYLLVDVGYNGTFHRSFQKLVPDAEFESFCLAAFSGAKDLAKSGKMHLVFGNVRKNELKIDPISRNVACLEALLMAPHPSFLKVIFDCEKEKLKFYFESKLSEEIYWVQHLQDAALRLIPKLSPVPLDQGAQVFEEWLGNPSEVSVLALSKLQLDDNYGGKRLRQLIPPYENSKVFSFRDAITFVEQSGWRDGALAILRSGTIDSILCEEDNKISFVLKWRKRFQKITRSRDAFLRHLRIKILRLLCIYREPQSVRKEVFNLFLERQKRKD